MTVIDDYINKTKPVQREQLERIRKIARQVVPDLSEVISYGMPTLKYQGKSFLGFNALKNHIGIYPFGGEEIKVFRDKLSAFGLSSGAIRVPYDNPIPEYLLIEIIKHRIKRMKRKDVK